MPSRRERRRAAAQQPLNVGALPNDAARELELAGSVVKLAYTREQAAEALELRLATLDRRVVPALATVSTDWGGRLIPVAELERYLAERTQPPRTTISEPRRPGRRLAVPPRLADRIRAEHASGSSLGEIARRLNAEGVETAQGGRQWWPSIVRSVLARAIRSRPSAYRCGGYGQVRAQARLRTRVLGHLSQTGSEPVGQEPC